MELEKGIVAVASLERVRLVRGDDAVVERSQIA
jgi:hypothetical protein